MEADESQRDFVWIPKVQEGICAHLTVQYGRHFKAHLSYARPKSSGKYLVAIIESH